MKIRKKLVIKNTKKYISSLLKYLYLLVCISIIGSIFMPLAKADVSTSASVLPQISDFEFNFASNDRGNTFPEQQTLTYTITYGAKKSAYFTTNMKIVAEFTQDTINGIHVLDYAFGSATDGYNHVQPIVDLTNRTITWNIPNLPAGTLNQTVSFQLKTNSNYSGTAPVNFSVKALMSNNFFSFPEQNVYQTLSTQITPAPQQTGITPTLAPTNAPTNPTPQPTPLPGASISSVFFNSVTNTQGQISVQTSTPSKISIAYGTSPNTLTQTTATGDYATYTQVILTTLKPHTNYYAQITTIDENGNITKSEIFTFKTAPVPPSVVIDKGVVVLSSDGNILDSFIEGAFDNAQTILPNTAAYEITYTLPFSTKIKSVEVAVRNKHVLGINTYAQTQEANMTLLPMIEKRPGVYFAQLPPIHLFGDFEVYVRVTETTGNIYEQKVSEIRISRPLEVVEKDTDQLLADARAYFSFYNQATKQFEPITHDFGNFPNPVFSDSKGLIHIVLPKGLYKVNVSSIFHGQITREFRVGTGTDYPTITLEKRPYDILGLAQYLGNALFDLSTDLSTYVLSVSITARYFNLFASLIIAITIGFTFILFSLKTAMPLKILPSNLYHYLHHTLLPTQQVILGRIMNIQHTPLPFVNVFVLTDDEKVLSHTTTNRQGIFTYKRQKEATHFHFMHEEFEQLNLPITNESNINITLIQNPDLLGETAQKITKSIGSIFEFFFEVLLALSLLLEFAFLMHFGLLHTLPFLILSFGNILLWLFYTKEVIENKMRR